ncbi:MAG: DsbA family oxidoreductase [Solirubrobacteraceae bacterium]
MRLTVDIWSDVVCPWCYLGKRRFEAALERFEHRDDVTVRWHSFELDTDAPQSNDEPAAERLARKYGMTVEEAEAKHAQMTEMGAAEGLEFRYDLSRSGNTFDAHRLIQLAGEHDLQDAVKERLLRAYFTEGEPIGDPERLVALVTEAGLDTDEARAVLDGDAYAEAVREDEQIAHQIGIRGVPFFVIGRRFGVSGAQPADALLGALERAWDESAPSAAA